MSYTIERTLWCDAWDDAETRCVAHTDSLAVADTWELRRAAKAQGWRTERRTCPDGATRLVDLCPRHAEPFERIWPHEHEQ